VQFCTHLDYVTSVLADMYLLLNMNLYGILEVTVTLFLYITMAVH
jgi:hypothetical protein